MEIQSAFSAGVQGFQKANSDANEAAAAIASATTRSEEAAVQNADASSAQSLNSNNDVTDVNQEIVNLKVAEHQANASAQVIKSADESLGTLIDVTA